MDPNTTIEEVLQRTTARFDHMESFESQTTFPCIRRGTNGKPTTVALFHIFYSSSPKFPNQEYKPIPLQVQGNSWHLSIKLTEDAETLKSVISALQCGKAAANAYISTDFPQNISLKGCSLGLAVWAAVMYLSPSHVFTGWVSEYGMTGGDFPGTIPVGPVQGTEEKISYCVTKGKPIFISSATINKSEDPELDLREADGQFYSFDKFVKGIPFSSRIHRAIVCSSTAEVVLLDLVIQAQQSLNQQLTSSRKTKREDE